MNARYFTLRDVGDYYEVSYETVRRWVDKGILRARKRHLGGQGPVLSVTEKQFDDQIPEIIAANITRLKTGLRADVAKRRQAREERNSDG